MSADVLKGADEAARPWPAKPREMDGGHQCTSCPKSASAYAILAGGTARAALTHELASGPNRKVSKPPHARGLPSLT